MTDIITILAAATANVTGTAFDAGDLKDGAALEVTTSGTVSAFSVQLQGSLDRVNWFAIGAPSATPSTSGEFTGFLARYFRAVLSAFSGTGTVTARIGVETGAGFPPLAQLDIRYSQLATAPAGAVGQTCARNLVSAGDVDLFPGSLAVTALFLPAGVPVNHITYVTGTTVEAGGSHGWYCLLDSSGAVRAVSADQSAATFWGTPSVPGPLSVASAGYVTPYTGLYYTGVCVVASTTPAFGSPAIVTAGMAALLPVAHGTAGAGFTTPPAIGTQLTLAGSVLYNYYAYVS